MAFHTYILRCADGSYYVGHTDDLERRVAQHEAGELAAYTATRGPVALVWSGDGSTREEALAFERRIKGWSRAKKEALIAGDWERVSALASRAKGPSRRGSAAPQDERGSAPAVRAEEGSESPSRSTSGETERGSVPPPAIVLVRPQLAENIGTAARAMLNFGLVELRLVAPRDGWPNPDAGPAASGADAVLREAAVFDSVAEAVADCAHVYATTVRKRGVTKPVVDGTQAAAAMRAGPGRSAVLFGPERAGLETEDVALARSILTIPVNPDFSSLNLAQAVILVAYEWSRGGGLAQPPAVPPEPPAPQAELDGMIDQLDAMLDAAGFYFPPAKAPTTKRAVRSILTKPGWSAQEVRTLRGVLSALQSPRPSKASSS